MADAFEAMTAARPYRMTPLTPEQALAELRKFAGVQFDPVVVDAFVRTPHVDGVADPGRPAGPRQIPLIAQAAERMTAPPRSRRHGDRRRSGRPSLTSRVGRPGRRRRAAPRGARPHDAPVNRVLVPPMLIGGIALGLILGLLVGGSITNLASVRLHRIGILVAAVILRFGTEILLNQGVPIAETLRVPLLAAAFGLLLVALWANRGYPGMSLAFIGVLANGIVILVNGGYMPIYLPSLELAGLTPADVTTNLHVVLGPALDANFLLHLGPFADVIPIPFPIVQNVVSIGDAFLTLGLAFFLFAAVVRVPQELDEEQLAAIRRRLAEIAATRPLRAGDPGAETGLSPALTGAVALERPLVLGSAGPGMASPSLSRPSKRTPRSPAPSRSPSRDLPRRSSASASTRTSASRSTARSRRCGRASSSRCSATGSTSWPSSRSSRSRRGRPSRRGSCSSRPRSRTCCSARSRARSSTAGTARR